MRKIISIESLAYRKHRLLYQVFSYAFLGYFLYGLIYLTIDSTLPTSNELYRLQLDNNAYIYDSAPTPQVISKIGVENRKDIKFNEINDSFKLCLLSKEDKDFYNHDGNSLRGIGRALLYSAILNKKQYGGGSTITNQLAKAILTRKRSSRIIYNKMREYFLSIKLESVLSKNQIMTLYLNKVEYGNGTIGLKEAASYYFDVSPFNLDLSQSATLVGIINNPTKNNPLKHEKNSVRERNIVYLSLFNNSIIDTLQFQKSCRQSIVLKRGNTSDKINNTFVDLVISEAQAILKKNQYVNPKTGQAYDIYSDGIDIYTSLKSDLQSESVASFDNKIPDAQSYIYDLIKTNYNNDDVISLYQSLLKQTDEYKELINSKAVLSQSQFEKAVKQINKTDVWNQMAQIDYACVVLDKDNKIISYLSNVEGNTTDNNQMPHQMGSVIKPFIYHYGLLTGYQECDYFSSARKSYDSYFNELTDSNDNQSKNNNKLWSPKNYGDNTYNDNSLYSYQGALCNSVNTITVQLYKALGPKNVENWVKSLGLKHFNGDNMSACLGTDENTPMNLLLAYTNMLRNNNTAINAVTKIVDNRNNRVLYQVDKNNTINITDIANTAKSLFSTKRGDKTKRNLFDETLTKRMTAMMLKTSLTGTAKDVRLNGFKSDFACKTGTTQNSQNSWLIGVSPNVSIVVWCGIKPSSINNNIIVGGALPSLIASNILAYTDYIYDYDNLSFNFKINSCVDKIRPVMMQDTLVNDKIMYNQ